MYHFLITRNDRIEMLYFDTDSFIYINLHPVLIRDVEITKSGKVKSYFGIPSQNPPDPANKIISLKITVKIKRRGAFKTNRARHVKYSFLIRLSKQSIKIRSIKKKQIALNENMT